MREARSPFPWGLAAQSPLSVRKQNLKSLIYFGIQINVKESGMATLEILFWKVPERLCACAVSGCGVVLLRTAGQVSW